MERAALESLPNPVLIIVSTVLALLHNRTVNSPADQMLYEYDFQPEIGEAIDILPGLKWLRLPLPFMLGHINVWLLQDDDGWAIVDTGINTSITRKTWESVFNGQLDNASVSRVLVTHLHPDHAGCAGWLCETHDVELYMTRDEYLLCRILVSDTDLPVPREGKRFYHAAGFAEEDLLRYQEMFGSFGTVVAQLPRAYHRLHEDRPVTIGQNEWQIITGHGHSPEHACLYNPQQNVLISGDQILPTISPNVSVYPTEPAANPLAGWFESLHRMKSLLPDDVLVLPSHGKPFRGVKGRLDALIEEHEVGLEKLRQYCVEPQRVVDVFPTLFKSEITDSNLMMATGEAQAHLSYLLYEGELGISTDETGVRWYQTR